MKNKYKINEIFYSLQGEGFHVGKPAVFIRFSGCNLQCSFCDTDFASFTEMTLVDIVQEALDVCGRGEAREGSVHVDMPMIVLTGGEPTLQADEQLVDALHTAGFSLVAMESNGTREAPMGVDWLTISPKGAVKVREASEVKVIFDEHLNTNTYGIKALHYFLQPCDTGNSIRNAEITAACMEYIKEHPKWRLSLQTHKLIGFR